MRKVPEVYTETLKTLSLCIRHNTDNVISLTQYYGPAYALPYGKRLVLMRQYAVFRVTQQAITIELLQANYASLCGLERNTYT